MAGSDVLRLPPTCVLRGRFSKRVSTLGMAWLPVTKSFCLVDTTLLVRRLHEESHADVSMM